jgi:hypothetical protein
MGEEGIDRWLEGEDPKKLDRALSWITDLEGRERRCHPNGIPSL